MSDENIYVYSWWSSLSVKITVTRSMDLVTDMVTEEKRYIRPNILSLLITFLFSYWPGLFLISPEVQIFSYSGTRWDC